MMRIILFCISAVQRRARNNINDAMMWTLLSLEGNTSWNEAFIKNISFSQIKRNVMTYEGDAQEKYLKKHFFLIFFCK